MLLSLSIICILLYLVAAAAISTRLFHIDGPLQTTAYYCVLAALPLHLLLLYLGISSEHGQNLSIVNVASLVAWIITCVITIVSYRNQQTFFVPLVSLFSALILVAGLLLPEQMLVHIELQPSLLIHISLAIFAYGILSIALLYALQLAFINHRLKHGANLLLHSSLPPLMEVEKNLFRLLLLGTLILTLSLFTGFVFLEDMMAQRQAHKTVLASLAWFIYVGLLIAHYRFGIRGQPVVLATCVGAVLLTLAYFGSRIVKEFILP